MGKRQEAAKLTKQKIIDAVKELSASKAYDEMSIDDITQTAGVAKGTFYVYFKRKEDVCAEIAYEKYQCLTEAITHKEISSVEKIACFLKESVKVVEGSTLEITQQWFRAVVAPTSDEWLGMRKLNFDFQFMKERIGEMISAGDLDTQTDTEGLAKIIVSEFYGAVILWCMSGGKIGLADIMEEFCDHRLSLLLK